MTFAKYGAKVVIGDMNGPGAEAVVESITKNGGEASSVKCNVTNWDDQVALFEHAFNRYGVVDIVIPNAGVTEVEKGVCSGELTIVDGKPVAPKLLTLDVNLKGVFYSVHLGVHYVKRNRAPNSWKAIVLTGSVASWVGLNKAPQYSASKHGVLGLMRAIDKIVTADNIRINTIHPWFAETSILDLPVKLMLAGMPMTPVPRVAGAIFRAATDPDFSTSGCPFVLPDDGPVIRVEKEALRAGVYKMLDDRVRRAASIAATVKFWARLVRDLSRIFRPVLLIGVPVAGLGVGIAVRRGLITLPTIH